MSDSLPRDLEAADTCAEYMADERHEANLAIALRQAMKFIRDSDHWEAPFTIHCLSDGMPGPGGACLLLSFGKDGWAVMWDLDGDRPFATHIPGVVAAALRGESA